MFEKARSLVLKDREAARNALVAEIEEQSRADLDADLNELAAEEKRRIAADEAERQRAEVRAKALRELREIRLAQHESATKFDAALEVADAEFRRIEELAVRAARLEAEAGEGDGRPVAVVGQARTGAIVAAIWYSAGAVARRVGLRRVPSGPHKIKPLASQYPEHNCA